MGLPRSTTLSGFSYPASFRAVPARRFYVRPQFSRILNKPHKDAVHLDCWMRAPWILTFWSSNSRVPLLGLSLLFVFLFLSKLIKTSTPFLSYVVLLWSMHGCTPHLFPSVLMGPSLCLCFSDLDMFISCCNCFHLYSGILCFFPHPLSHFVPRQ